MKITKEKLTKIIAEEIQNTLNELNFKEETTDETLDSIHFPPVNKPTKKCPEGETMSSKSGKCEPNRVKPSLRQEQ